MKLSTFKKAGQALEDGVWKRYVGDFEVCLRSMRSRAFEAAVAKLSARHRRKGKLDMSEDDAAEIQRQAVAETIIVDWRGLEDEGGPVAYSAETALELFASNNDFYRAIVNMAQELGTLEAAAEEAELKNSARS